MTKMSRQVGIRSSHRHAQAVVTPDLRTLLLGSDESPKKARRRKVDPVVCDLTLDDDDVVKEFSDDEQVRAIIPVMPP
jgi:hypothetical protein